MTAEARTSPICNFPDSSHRAPGLSSKWTYHAGIDQGCGMRATGGAVKPPARSCSRSHRICQIRPITKPTAIATEISKAITRNKVIGVVLSSPMPLSCARKGYRSVFHAARSVNRAGAGWQHRQEGGGLLCERPLLFAIDRYNCSLTYTQRKVQPVSMFVKAEGPSGRANIRSDDPKHALDLVQYLRTIGYNALAINGKQQARRLHTYERSSGCTRETRFLVLDLQSQ
jgi:hypothetical protein